MEMDEEQRKRNNRAALVAGWWILSFIGMYISQKYDMEHGIGWCFILFGNCAVSMAFVIVPHAIEDFNLGTVAPLIFPVTGVGIMILGYFIGWGDGNILESIALCSMLWAVGLVALIVIIIMANMIRNGKVQMGIAVIAFSVLFGFVFLAIGAVYMFFETH